jgi:regulator of sigma E protease
MTHPNPWKQFTNVLEMTWRSLKSVTAGVKRQLGFDAGYTTLGVKHLSGPVGIGKHLYLSVYRGSLIIGLNLVVLITFNLGLLNLMPIPLLDGGHIVLSLLEMIFRRKVPAKVLQPIAIAFITILIAFMIFVTFYDVKKMIPVSKAKKPAAAEKTENAKP